MCPNWGQPDAKVNQTQSSLEGLTGWGGAREQRSIMKWGTFSERQALWVSEGNL